jgi:uncharacterized membrane protein YbjE (DUF340 family)
MESIFVTGIVFFFVYKTVELFVRQKERRVMVEKMTEISVEMLQQNLNSMQSVQSDSLLSRKFSTLRWGALLLGVGIGWILGWILYCIQLGMYYENNDFYNLSSFRHAMDSTFIASTVLCAGIALIIVYSIERKAYKR